jgi:hypothetical protein
MVTPGSFMSTMNIVRPLWRDEAGSVRVATQP